MKFITLLAGLLAAVTQIQAASVIAHFMLINTKNYTMSDFEDDFKLAKDAHIDAFALNMGMTDPHTPEALEVAFTAAKKVGFHLLFSFDYKGGEHGGAAWPKETILDMADKYFKREEYLKYGGKPVASTFEGTENAEDWIELKQKTNAFFIPDWSSVAPEEALTLAGGVADGLFSWNAWPVGDQNMNTKSDAAYKWALKGKPYMMPVSPWFYTNLPGYKKNWVWRGDDLWYDRWAQVLDIKPEFVQIISWNDYGESHHIGPVRSNALEAFQVGEAPFNYALDHPHDGWRHFLPYLIDTYKGAIAADIKQEGLMAWYRGSPALACADGGTVGNSESQSQRTFAVSHVVQDKIFFSALLTSWADVTVTVNGKTQKANWTSTPDDYKGVFHGSVPFVGGGDVEIIMYKYSTEIARIQGKKILTDCVNGLTNWNAWVGSTNALHVDDPNPTPTQTGDGPRSTASDNDGGGDESAATSLSLSRGVVCSIAALVSMAIAGAI
ncbi:glycosyl hydrolase family 71 [Colletotrichum karsti]|uniref:Glycosyl hydrolase family 71 n=1 Tax=Colletotrichum karsti TaxID=1095194 RepID=A0A9P6LJ89_9PEZI|nr:glycosyl hydrolase family 71 [Colletotrichum karsti]KAF9874560.1 glycosyl hydrolase family 71 [Colletotrichum karsti]